MGMPAIVGVVSLDEYLSDPAYEHCEYVDGQVLEHNVGTKSHAKIQGKCFKKLDDHLEKKGTGYAAVELHCRLKIAGRIRFRLPDVSVVLGDESPEERYLDRAPDLVVEVRSPEDSISYLTRKMDEYFDNGARLGWLVLPEERSVLVFRPQSPTRTVLPGEILDGAGLLPDLQIPVDSLFA